MRTASALSFGLPNISRPKHTVVSAHNTGAVWQGLALQAQHSGVEFEACDPRHVARWRFRTTHSFQRLGVFVRPGQQQFVGHSDLRPAIGCAEGFERRGK
jgi:hypothetical protein